MNFELTEPDNNFFTRKVHEIPAGEQNYSFKLLPRTVFIRIVRLLGIKALYYTGLVSGNNLFGNTAFLSKTGEAGFTDFISKPIDTPKLLEIIKNYLKI